LVGSFLVVPKENLIWEVSHRPGTELDFDSGDRERGDRQPGDFRTTNFAPSQLASLATSITTALPPTGSSPTVTYISALLRSPNSSGATTTMHPPDLPKSTKAPRSNSVWVSAP